MSKEKITPEELGHYNYLMAWTEAAKDLNRDMLYKLRDQMIEVMDGKVNNSIIAYANKKEDIMKYTQYGLLVINKTIELLDAIEMRKQAALNAKDSFLTAIIMFNTMNRKDDDN